MLFKYCSSFCHNKYNTILINIMKKDSNNREAWHLVVIIALGIMVAELAIYIIKTMHGI